MLAFLTLYEAVEVPEEVARWIAALSITAIASIQVPSIMIFLVAYICLSP